MRPSKPRFQHPPEVHQSILREHRDDPMRLAQRLQACGWSLADAAWAAVNWPPLWLAAAIANARDAAASPRPRKTTRIVRRTTPRIKPPPPPKP